jgi:hypothetical protein
MLGVGRGPLVFNCATLGEPPILPHPFRFRESLREFRKMDEHPRGRFEAVFEIMGKLTSESVQYQWNTLQEISGAMSRLAQQQWKAALETAENFIRKMHEITESDAEVIAPLLLQANLWLSPSLSISLLYKLKKMAERGEIVPEIVKQTFVEHYEVGEWAVLKSMVSSWQDNPYFSNRMPILYDALKAHIDGKYTLVVPTLLAQIEGVLSSILETPAGSTTGMVKTAIEERQTEYLSAASKDILIKFAISPAGYGGVKGEYFTPEKFPEWLESKGLAEDQALNRHAILHGVQLNYGSKENSLRAFLLLDVLYWMRREEWDEELKWTLGK